MPYKVEQGKEVYESVNGVDIIEDNRYAKDVDQSFYYPKDPEGEYLHPTIGLIKKDDKYVYPLTTSDLPRYCKDGDEKELYENPEGTFIIGVGKDGNEYYAKDKDGNEYYPEGNIIAVKSDGTKFYAKTKDDDTIFPLDSKGNQIYVTKLDTSKPYTIPTKYAKCIGINEVYPIRTTIDGKDTDEIIGEKYALNQNDESFYPKDGYGNEFYLPPISATGIDIPANKILLKYYAVTNDGRVILPLVGNKYYIDTSKQPAIMDEDIVGRMIREGTKSSDYLTKVKSPVTSISIRQSYKYIDLLGNEKIVDPNKTKSVSNTKKTTIAFYQRWYFWVIVVVSVIIKMFAVWWFMFRRHTTYRVN